MISYMYDEYNSDIVRHDVRYCNIRYRASDVRYQISYITHDIVHLTEGKAGMATADSAEVSSTINFSAMIPGAVLSAMERREGEAKATMSDVLNAAFAWRTGR
jgi:hypothetical protein